MSGKTGIAILTSALLFIPLAHASTAAANATDSKVPWRGEPKERGSLGILLSCFFTLIVCIWTVIHDDVILNGTPFSRLLSKVQWMLYAFLAPETVISSAFTQWLKARDLHKGFCARRGVDRDSAGDSLGLEGAFFVVMGGFSKEPMDYKGEYSGLVDADKFMKLVPPSSPLPHWINRRLISDRGKADAIGKALALTQAFSLVIQCLLRKIQGLTVTLLEFHVVIQVFCAALIYFFWWHKPQGVVEPIPVSNGTMENTGDNLPPQAALFSWSTLREIRNRLERWGSKRREGLMALGNLHLFQLVDRDGSPTIIGYFIPYSMYGALHSIAWNSSFPTPIEQLLWRISCISLIIAPIIFIATVALEDLPHVDVPQFFIQSTYAIIFFHVLICRAFITIECLISLRLLPANTYETVLWERIWPHL